jgi:hypothetical protein
MGILAEAEQAGVLNILANRITLWYRCRSFRRSLDNLDTERMEREMVAMGGSRLLTEQSSPILDWVADPSVADSPETEA